MVGKVTDEDIEKLMPKEEDSGKGKKKKPVMKSSNPIPNKVVAEKEMFETNVKPETIELSVHKEKMKSLQTKYDKLEEKYGKLNDSNKETKAELAKLKKAYESEKKKRENADTNLASAKKELETAKTEMKKLRKTAEKNDGSILKEKDDEIAKISKQLKNKESKMAAADDKIKKLQDDLVRLESEKKDLVSENERLQKELDAAGKKTDDGKEDGAGEIIISRISATEFSSSSFTGTRYRVNLSKDCTFMTFKVDITGSAVCVNGTIMLPAIANYVPFSGKKDYRVQMTPNGEMMIPL